MKVLLILTAFVLSNPYSLHASQLYSVKTEMVSDDMKWMDWIHPGLVTAVPDSIRVPSKLHSNSEVKLKISGTTLNSCYHKGPIHVEIDQENRKLYVNNQLYLIESSWCLQVVKRYSQTINLGFLPQGSYEVISWDDRGMEHYFGGFSVL